MALALLLHFNGSGTTITDAVSGNSWTANGTATQTGTGAILGAASLVVDGTSSVQSTTAALLAALNFGTASYRMDIRLKAADSAAPPTFYVTLMGTNNWEFRLRNFATELEFDNINPPGWGGAVLNGNAHLITVSRDGSDGRMYGFLDGTLLNAGGTLGSSSFGAPTSIAVGSKISNLEGWHRLMDEVRIETGVAQTTSFTDAGTEWPDPAGSGIDVAGIPSAEAFGAPVVSATVVAAGIASAEAVPGPVIGASIVAAGIASAEAFGSSVVGADIAAAGIASAEAFGAPVVSAGIAATGIASGEAFGLPVVAGDGVFVAGIPSEEAFGQPSIDAGIVAAGIASAEAFGLPTIGVPDVAVEQQQSYSTPSKKKYNYDYSSPKAPEAVEPVKPTKAPTKAVKQKKSVPADVAEMMQLLEVSQSVTAEVLAEQMVMRAAEERRQADEEDEIVAVIALCL